MASSERLLEQTAKDGVWESDNWPQVLEDLLLRLDAIVRSEFPRPTLPPEPPRRSPTTSRQDDGPSSQDSTTSNKENAPAKSPTSRPPVPSFRTVPTQSQLGPGISQDDDEYSADYPPDLIALYSSIKKNLKNNFPKYPPHTVQRLAELILYPKGHYRYLPPYLHALDRVVSVSSTTSIFPLPQARLPSSNSYLNGDHDKPSSFASPPELGSDESLGGALLTPIPWLTNSRASQPSSGTNSEKELQISNTQMVEGPNGAGRIETVNVVNGVMAPVSSHAALGLPAASSTLASQNQPQTTEEALRAEGAVTQGELLRQEQEAGVVPVQPRALRMSEEEMDRMDPGTGADDEKPHARGPDEIGMEDTGPQERPQGAALSMEAAVGRNKRESSVERELDPEDASLSDAGGGREEEMKDSDGSPVQERKAEAAKVEDAAITNDSDEQEQASGSEK